MNIEKDPSGKPVFKLPNVESLQQEETNTIPTNIGRAICTVDDLLTAAKDKTIRPYENNRGQGKLALSTVKRVSKHFSADSLGEITLAQTNTRGKLVVVDGHSRIYGLIKRLISGNLTPAELRSEVHLRIIPKNKTIEVYKDLNAGQGHSGMNKLTNPDLAFGDLIQNKLFPELSDVQRSYLKSSHYKNLSYIAYSVVSIPRKDLDYKEVFLSRKDTKPLEDMVADDLNFPIQMTDKQWKDYVDAVKFYCDFRIELDSSVPPNLKRQVLKGIESGPFAGVIIVDQLKPVKEANNFKILAKQVLKNITDIKPLIPVLTHSTNSNITKAVSDLWRAIKKRRR